MSALKEAIDAAERTLLELRAENDELRRQNEALVQEIRRLGERPCHYCDVVGHHSEDCPVQFDEVAARLPVG